MGQLKKKTKSADTPNKKRKLEAPEADSPSKPGKKVLAEQSFEEFLQGWDNSDGGGSGDDEAPNNIGQQAEAKEKKKKITKKKIKKSDDSKLEKKKIEKKVKKEDSSDEEDVEKDIEQQKDFIGNLQEKDPEFFKFLQKEESALLDFGKQLDDEDGEAGEGQIHILPQLDELEEESDEEYDFEPEDDNIDTGEKIEGKITHEMVKEWTEVLKSNLNLSSGVKIFKTCVEALKAAIATIDIDTGIALELKYKCQGASIFNAIIRMCVIYVYPALKKMLRMFHENERYIINKNKKNKRKLLTPMKFYLQGICVLVSRLQEPESGAIIIKHTMQMIPFFQNYEKVERMLVQSLITCWGQGHDSVRVASLLCLVKLGRVLPKTNESILKQMFDSYVKNSKFTSPSNMATINFMRRSLVEIYGLDHKLAYYQGFVQIRQLAILLRTAMTEPKKEHIQAVYNWQFIHSIELWGALLCAAAESELIRPLIYPFVQVTLGTIKLVKGQKFYPLKFHCAKVLTEVSLATGTFIPVLPIYVDILNSYDFNKKSKSMSFKPMDFTCVLKVPTNLQKLSGFKDSIIEEIYGGMLKYLAMHSHKIGFPELITPMVIQARSFFKNCKSSSYTKQIKQILEKATANGKLIETKRRSVTFGVSDAKEIRIWEAKVERDGTPIMAFYQNWKKAHEQRKMVRLSDKRNIMSYDDVPVIDKALLEKKKKKLTTAEAAKRKDDDEEKGFLSGEDSESEIPDEARFTPRFERDTTYQEKYIGKKKLYSDSESDDNDTDADGGDDNDGDDNDVDDDDFEDDGSDMEDGEDKDDEEDVDGSESGGENSDEGKEGDGKDNSDDGSENEDEVQELGLDDLDQMSEEDEAMKDDFGVGDDYDDDDDDDDDVVDDGN